MFDVLTIVHLSRMCPVEQRQRQEEARLKRKALEKQRIEEETARIEQVMTRCIVRGFKRLVGCNELCTLDHWMAVTLMSSRHVSGETAAACETP